jgi:NHL repeat-containing protein
MYIADTDNNRIRRLDALTGYISTVAGTGSGGFSGDGGPAISATLSAPRAVTVDAMGNLYIADTNNSRIRRVRGESGVSCWGVVSPPGVHRDQPRDAESGGGAVLQQAGNSRAVDQGR